MYRVGVSRNLRARHFLVGDFGDETKPHEHAYSVEWVCAVGRLNADGFGLDIAVAAEVLGKIVESTEGQMLNDLPFFHGRQPSVENLARMIHDEAMKRLTELGLQGLDPLYSEVRIRESEDAWASYRSNDGQYE